MTQANALLHRVSSRTTLDAIETVLEVRGWSSVRHAHWSIREHLRGTEQILNAWKEPAGVRLAGFLHNAYSTDSFDHALFSLDEREKVRSLIGERAEELVYLFCTIERGSIFDAAQRRLDKQKELTVSSRVDGSLRQLAPSQARDLLVIHMANIAEQSAAANRSPVEWMDRVSRLGTLVQGLDPRCPPVFDGCSKRVGLEGERRLLATYVAALRTCVDNKSDAAGNLWGSALAVPWVGEPWIWLGYLALASGDHETALRHGARGAQLLWLWGMAWDKRLTAPQWSALGSLLQRISTLAPDYVRFLGERVRALLHSSRPRPEGLYLALSEASLLARVAEPFFEGETHARALGDEDGTAISSLAADPADYDEVPPRFIEYVSELRHNQANPRMKRYPSLSARPWWNAEDSAIARALEESASSIIEEFHAIDPRCFHRESEPILRDGDWSVFFLYERGRKHEENCKLVPVTTRIVESCRTVRTQSGLIYFSRMAPNTVISAHSGPTNMRLRCHLGIDIPDGCGINVDGVARSWIRGKCVIFDDSFIHEAWNNSNQERTVLIVDIWHPDLSDDEVAMLEGLERHVGCVAEGIHRYWRRNEKAAAAPSH